MLGKAIFMNIMKGINSLFWIFLGGGVGSIFRYTLSFFFKTNSNGFPTATFFVNVLGCFLIGLLYSLIHIENSSLKLVLIVGFLGGFTTFSSFGNETLFLFNKGQVQTALLYVILSNICGLAAVYIGTRISILFS